jgi:acetyl esterase
VPSLHPQIEKALKAMADAKLRPIEEMTPAEARQQMEIMAAARTAEPLPVAHVDERMIPGPGDEIRLRLYWPRELGPVPAIVYYHGGGHVIGSLDTHDLVARNLCAGTKALVASVEYRMGPEHKFPAAVDDSFAALQWVHANAETLGADPDRIGVHGDSAGGNLAAVIALLARDTGRPAAAPAITRLSGYGLSPSQQ